MFAQCFRAFVLFYEASHIIVDLVLNTSLAVNSIDFPELLILLFSKQFIKGRFESIVFPQCRLLLIEHTLEGIIPELLAHEVQDAAPLGRRDARCWHVQEVAFGSAEEYHRVVEHFVFLQKGPMCRIYCHLLTLREECVGATKFVEELPRSEKIDTELYDSLVLEIG